MEVVVSTLFRVMHFPHNGNIVTIDQLSFDNPYACKNPNHSIPLCLLIVQVVSTPPWVNYVASYPMCSISNEKEPLFSCSSSLDSIPASNLGCSPLRALEHVLSLVGQSECYDVCSLQDLLPSDEVLLEFMVNLDIPLNHFDKVLSKDYVLGWDPFAVKPNSNLPFQIDLTIGRSI